MPYVFRRPPDYAAIRKRRRASAYLRATSNKYTVNVATATLSLTPQTVSLPITRKVSVAQANLTFTPENVSVSVRRVVSVAQATLTFTPESVSLPITRTVSVAQGTLTFAPQNVALRVNGGVIVAVQTGNLTFTPGTVDLAVHRMTTVAVDHASLSLTPQSVSPIVRRVVAVAQASLTFTPKTVSFVLSTPARSYSVTVAGAQLSFRPQQFDVRKIPARQVYPNTATRLETPLIALIKKRDPTFFRDRAKVTEYQFSNGRTFTGNPSERGAYGDVTGPDDLYVETTPDVSTLEDVYQEP